MIEIIEREITFLDQWNNRIEVEWLLFGKIRIYKK